MSETGLIDVPFNQDAQPAESQASSTPGEQPNVDSESPSKKCDAAGSPNEETNATSAEEDQEFLRKLPPEIGTLLVMVGIAGLLLPGVIGTPLIIAGAVVIWPKTFEPLERRFAKNYPKSHKKGIQQVKRFIQDLDRRFPESSD